MSKKIILDFPAEGFTGETVEHTLTKTNIANQPELAERGFKVGDVVKIIKSVNVAPIAGETAATNNTTATGDGIVATEAPETEVVVLKVKGNPKRAKEIADAHSVDFVFENKKGEFFTSKNLALLSVGQDKSKIITHSF